MNSVNVVAEIGCNHQGDVFTALRMISVAAGCGVDAVKCQKRNPKRIPKEQYDKPYENPNSFGLTYGEHRERLELSIASHHLMCEKARSLGIMFSDSVWDRDSLQEILTLNLPYLKIPSAKNTDWDFLKAVASEFKGQIHISNGMISNEDEKKLVDMFAGRLVLYVCTSAYPCEAKDVKLLDIPRFRKEYGSALAGIGFSGHHRGISLDIAAAAFGATWVERHFTLDRTMKGTDHAASLEPQGMEKLVRDIRAVQYAMDYRKGVLDCEKDVVRKLKPEYIKD